MQTPPLPGIAQLVQRHRHRAESRGWFALEKAEALGQLIGNQVAQADVVDEHDQANTVQRIFGIRAHGHIAGDDGNLGLKVDTHGRAGHDHIVTGTDEVIAAALVHQRVTVEIGGYLGVARLAHQLHVVDIGRAIGPLVSTWQRRHAAQRVKREGMACLAAVELMRQILQLGSHITPVIQHLLHAVGNASGIAGLTQVARHHDQLPVTRAILVRCQLHALSLCFASVAGTMPDNASQNYDWLN